MVFAYLAEFPRMSSAEMGPCGFGTANAAGTSSTRQKKAAALMVNFLKWSIHISVTYDFSIYKYNAGVVVG
jgi:hypothetical protein